MTQVNLRNNCVNSGLGTKFSLVRKPPRHHGMILPSLILDTTLRFDGSLALSCYL